MKLTQEREQFDGGAFRGLATALALTVVLALIFVGGMFAGKAWGQEWHEANQATVAWDATTALANGDPIPADNTIEYAVYLSNATTDPDKTAPALLVDNLTTLIYTITLGSEGKFFVGVQAIRRLADGTEVSNRSLISWSDDTGAASVPFGLIRYVPPQDVTGLSVQ